MEYRIGAEKRLISNLGGSNFKEENVQLVNSTVDIKEELFWHTRQSHGVSIRSGKRNPRSDSKDYICSFLTLLKLGRTKGLKVVHLETTTCQKIFWKMKD